MKQVNESFPRRAIYFAIGFIFPALLLICSTIVACAVPRTDHNRTYIGAGVLSAFSIFISLICLYNDTKA